MSYQDPYKTLGVDRSATDEEIAKAYRKLARKYHPDVNKDADAEARFKELGQAYEILKDPEKRKLFDQYGSTWKNAQGGGASPAGGMPDLSDLFETIFGGRGANGNAGPFSGSSSPFGDAFGGQGGFSFHVQEGAFDGFARQPAPEPALTLEVSIPEAFSGTTRTLSLSEPTGAARTLRVKVPAGVRDGQRIRLPKQGAKRRDGARADVYLEVRLKGDDIWRLEGDDVVTRLDLTPWQAALGDSVPITTLDGSGKVKIPAGTSSGRRIRLRGKGLKHAKGEARGDLYAEVRIVVSEPSDEERALYEQLRNLANGQPSTARSDSEAA